MFKSMVGEPLCVGQYEEIIAMGSKRLILLGNCGVLDKRIEDCGIIIPIKAVRDEEQVTTMRSRVTQLM